MMVFLRKYIPAYELLIQFSKAEYNIYYNFKFCFNTLINTVTWMARAFLGNDL
jgi:hypothetical protein